MEKGGRWVGDVEEGRRGWLTSGVDGGEFESLDEFEWLVEPWREGIVSARRKRSLSGILLVCQSSSLLLDYFLLIGL